MVKVDEYARIRRAHVVDGLGIRVLARQFVCVRPTAFLTDMV
jgi:hypothetical protein